MKINGSRPARLPLGVNALTLEHQINILIHLHLRLAVYFKSLPEIHGISKRFQSVVKIPSSREAAVVSTGLEIRQYCFF